MGIIATNLGLQTTATRYDIQSRQLQRNETNYGMIQALGDAAINNPALLEDPNVQVALHKFDKKQALEATKDWLAMLQNEQAAAEGKRMREAEAASKKEFGYMGESIA